MAPNQVDAASIPDSESSTVYTPSTTSNDINVDLKRQSTLQSPLDSSVPWPGSTFIIYSVLTGKAITLEQGRVVLGTPGGIYPYRWRCVDNGGWLGFREPGSQCFLGYDKNEELCCEVRWQKEWENFCVRHRPEGGYSLLMSHYDNWTMIAWKKLWSLGIKVVNGSEKLAIIEDSQCDSTVWKFVKV